MNTVPIREQEAFAGRLLRTPNGETVLDFGQNMAGYVEMKLPAHAGQKIKLLCGEALDENGNFTQENFQDRNRHKEGGTAQMLELVCKREREPLQAQLYHYGLPVCKGGNGHRPDRGGVYRPRRLFGNAGHRQLCDAAMPMWIS